MLIPRESMKANVQQTKLLSYIIILRKMLCLIIPFYRCKIKAFFSDQWNFLSEKWEGALPQVNLQNKALIF